MPGFDLETAAVLAVLGFAFMGIEPLMDLIEHLVERWRRRRRLVRLARRTTHPRAGSVVQAPSRPLSLDRELDSYVAQIERPR